MNHNSDPTPYMTESERGALVVDIETAGVIVRRLARKYKLAPVGEVRRVMDDAAPWLKVRYLAKNGLSLDAFAELLADSVCAGRPSPGRACELLEMFVRGRRSTHAEAVGEHASIEQMVAIAHADLATQTAAVEAWDARVKRGSKLIPWVCCCTRPVTVQVFWKSQLRVTCDECGSPYRPKYTAPTLDHVTIAATESVPF